MAIERVLIVEDELLIRGFLAETLTRKGMEVEVAENGKKGLALFKQNPFDLVITDMKMPEMGGLELLSKIKEYVPQTIVIVITAFGSIENAVEAMRKGAFHYLLKPFTPDAIEAMIEKANEHVCLVRENTFLKESQTEMPIIAVSLRMRKILEEIKRIAKSHATVLIHGESGTGKEVVAHAIHAFSARASCPYIRVNCAAIPDTLLESEFFGHEKGAFTGANLKRIGRFELADKGTLLLDEVTEIPIHLQPKLLRVIQEQEFERVGGSRPISVDTRLIATSNRDLSQAIKEGIFREDLYYRLSVVPIHLPPLRERKEDIIPLGEYFLKKCCIENHVKPKTFSVEACEKLSSYLFPGNIRELANIIERVVVLDFGPVVEADHLHFDSMFVRT